MKFTFTMGEITMLMICAAAIGIAGGLQVSMGLWALFFQVPANLMLLWSVKVIYEEHKN